MTTLCGTERGYRRHLKLGESTDCGRGCRAANSRAVKARLVRRGQAFTTPARSVARLAELRAAGMTMSAVAKAAGLSHDTLTQLGSRPRVLRSTEAALLAVQPALGDGAHVPRVGTLRRIQALLRLGWPHAELAARSGVNTAVLLSQPHAAVTVRVARLVGGLFDELSMRPGPSQVTAGRAARLGYAPPLAWDDDSIDDPKARPHGVGRRRESGGLDELVVQLLADGVVPASKARLAERREAVRVLAARGLDDGQIADRVGLSRGAVLKIRDRAGIAAAVPAVRLAVAS